MQDSQTRLVLRAIVKDNKDPQGLGRVQVVYPSFQGNSSELKSNWAQVVGPYASSGHGAWFLPSVGDQVLVLLESSNLSSPVVVGSLYHDQNPPPKSGKSGDLNADGKNSVRFIRTPSGNQLVFNEAAGSESIESQHASGSAQKLAKNAVNVKDGSGAQLNLADGKVALGNASAELFDLLQQLLSVLEQSASTMVSTAVGPGVLNPSVTSKVSEIKAKIAQMKGKLE